MEKATNSVLATIQQCQSNGTSIIRHPSWGPQKQLNLSRNLSMAEGQRLKRQFVQLNKAKPLSSGSGGEQTIIASFIDYIALNCT